MKGSQFNVGSISVSLVSRGAELHAFQMRRKVLAAIELDGSSPDRQASDLWSAKLRNDEI